MKFNLNGEFVEIEGILTVESIINKYNLDSRKIAVEKNMEIVPRSTFSKTEISEGDNIEIIHFIGGG